MSKNIIFHTPIFLYALIFTGGLYIVARWMTNDIVYLGISITILALLAAIAGRIIAKHFFFAIVPVVLSVSLLVLLFFVDSTIQKMIMIIFTGALVYLVTLGSYRLSHSQNDAIARGMVVFAATTALFFFFASLFAVYLNFIIPKWWVSIVTFSITAIMSWHYYVLIARGLFVQTILYSGIVGIIMAQIALVATLWPFSYMTISIILLMVYYIIWDMGQGFFLNRLSKVRIVTNITFLLIVSVIVLISAQWLPII